MFLEDVLLDPNGDVFKCRTGETTLEREICDLAFEREKRHVSILLEISSSSSLSSSSEKSLLDNIIKEYFPSVVEISEIQFQSIKNALNFVRAVKRRISPKKENKASVLIVGGGPAGLLTAIETHRRGYRVRVVEKRRYHSRKVWFDLLSSEVGEFRGLETLRSWGLEFLPHLYNTSVMEAPGTLTIPCRTLEIFLARILLLLDNVEINYETTFLGFTEKNGFAILRRNHDDDKEDETCIKNDVKYDIVVGADGTRSAVRNAADIGMNTLDRFGKFRLRDLKQTTTILSLQVDPSTGHCPSLRKIRQQDVSPFDPAFESIMNGTVTSAWKRWNPPFCEIQVLWTNLFAETQRDHTDEKLLDLMHVILQNPPNNQKEFRDMLDVRSGDVNVHTYDVRISRSSRFTKTIQGDVTVVLIGDAAQSSHYRLGVGINRVFDVVNVFGESISSSSSSITTSAFDEDHFVRGASDVLNWLQYHQLKAMYFEAYCDCAVHEGNVYSRRLDGTREYDLIEDESVLMEMVSEGGRCTKPLEII